MALTRLCTELARKNGVTEATLYNWKARYGGMDASQLRRLKELEGENLRPKRMYAELSLARSAYYAPARPKDDGAIVAAIEAYIGENQQHGFDKLYPVV